MNCEVKNCDADPKEKEKRDLLERNVKGLELLIREFERRLANFKAHAKQIRELTEADQ